MRNRFEEERCGGLHLGALFEIMEDGILKELIDFVERVLVCRGVGCAVSEKSWDVCVSVCVSV